MHVKVSKVDSRVAQPARHHFLDLGPPSGFSASPEPSGFFPSDCWLVVLKRPAQDSLVERPATFPPSLIVIPTTLTGRQNLYPTHPYRVLFLCTSTRDSLTSVEPKGRRDTPCFTTTPLFLFFLCCFCVSCRVM